MYRTNKLLGNLTGSSAPWGLWVRKASKRAVGEGDYLVVREQMKRQEVEAEALVVKIVLDSQSQDGYGSWRGLLVTDQRNQFVCEIVEKD